MRSLILFALHAFLCSARIDCCGGVWAILWATAKRAALAAGLHVARLHCTTTETRSTVNSSRNLCLAATARCPSSASPSVSFSLSLASFECYFCPCGLRHFNFNLMRATNKQIKCPNAPYEYERAETSYSWGRVGRRRNRGMVNLPNLQV